MTKDQNTPSWWKTAPGVLTAVGGVITAVATLIVALNQIGMFDNKHEPQRAEEVMPSHPIQQTTDGWTIIGETRSGKFFDLKLMVHGDSPAIGRSYDAVEDFRLIQKRLKKGGDLGQVVTLGIVHRGDTVEVIDLYIPVPSTEMVPVWGKLRAVLHKR
ncbi:MAG: hypothetical protein V7739_17840 [Motiliproteus sp.]